MPYPLVALPSRPGSDPGLPSQYSLPTPLTPLLGREGALAHLVALLRREDVRLLTLTGPGGVGKTRLALEAARDLLPDFADGIAFVPLSAISDPSFVLPALAQALLLRETDAHAPLEALQAALGSRSLLLLLDNFEQVLAAAPLLADLLAACPRLKLLVTSRAPLRLRGEQELTLFPLAVPNLASLPAPDTLSQYAACALFIQRVQAIKPQFQLTEATVRPIAEICVRLDGLPLAIELAAARMRVLSPQALLARLARRLDLLTSGARDAPARQQTMRATMAWSYQLLTHQEQRLFRHLSIFVGGCTLEALDAVAQAAGLAAQTVLNAVNALLENHLVQQREQPDGQSRLELLETIREYGLECLESEGELEAAHAVHAQYFLTFAEETESHLRGKEQAHFMAQLEHERENLRAVLSFLLEHVRQLADRQERERRITWALRLCIALSYFWYIRGYGGEGLHFLDQALAAPEEMAVALRTRTLSSTVDLALIYARHLPLERLAEQNLELCREAGDAPGTASSLLNIGSLARIRSQFALARLRLEEAAAAFQQLGDRWKLGQSWTELARVAIEAGQYEQAQALLTQSLRLYQRLGDRQRIAWVVYLEAFLLFVQDADPAQAHQLAEQSRALFEQQGNRFFTDFPLALLGSLHLHQGELQAARPLLEACLAVSREKGIETEAGCVAFGLVRLLMEQGEVETARGLCQEYVALLVEYQVYKEDVAVGLETLAALETTQDNALRAAQLWGAAEALRKAIGAPRYPVYRVGYERAITHACTHIGEQSFHAAWLQGCRMTPEQALREAIGIPLHPIQRPRQEHAQDSTCPSMSEWRLVWEESRHLNPEQVLVEAVQQRRPAALSLRPTAPASPPSPSLSVGLTAREIEVLRYLAQGCTDAQIAERLVISPRTVNRHTTSLYSKLGVSSRAAATRSAIQYHLL
jgi:predicted ATPase/DNA-binding CsgD family transcriptional regulator